MRHMKYKTRKLSKIMFLLSIIFVASILGGSEVFASTETPIPFSVDFSISSAENGKDVVGSLQILFILTLISLAPSILIMMTCFTRIIVVLHFVRSALATQQTPPNQVLVGLALFITLFVMAPVMSDVNETALKPYSAGEISQEEAIDKGLGPIREFMLKQVNDKDLALFLDIAENRSVNEIEDIPTSVLIPAFIISELRAAFIIGFLIYIPFIVVDMVVASTLMSMGMMMLPPVMISLPFKLMLFVLADGWNLIIGELVKTIRF